MNRSIYRHQTHHSPPISRMMRLFSAVACSTALARSAAGSLAGSNFSRSIGAKVFSVATFACGGAGFEFWARADEDNRMNTIKDVKTNFIQQTPFIRECNEVILPEITI